MVRSIHDFGRSTLAAVVELIARLFYTFTKFIARLRGAVGWCGMAYVFNRTPFIIREEGYEDWVHEAMNPITAWWGAFIFKWRNT